MKIIDRASHQALSSSNLKPNTFYRGCIKYIWQLTRYVAVCASKTIWLGVAFVVISACGEEAGVFGDDTLGQRVDYVIYGNDDRLDYYDVTEPWQRQVVEKSVAVLVDADVVRYNGNKVTLNTEPYDYVCPSERFYGQPEPGWCSGTLIDRQLFMTAGHCLDSCDDTHIVFRFYYPQEGVLQELTADDVYQCGEILAHSNSNEDFSIIKLDRPVAQHLEPVPLRTSNERLQIGTAVSVIGFPMGLPAKVAGGAWVTSPGSGPEFEANTDTYAGNSGSGVFTDDGAVAGIHVDGQKDFDSQDGCDVSNHLPDSDGSEGQTYAYVAFRALCDAGVASGPVCNKTECGDDLCSSGESCPQDCATVPGWICAPQLYSDGVRCNCNCGIPDPDCNNSTLPVDGCSVNQICDDTASCVSKPLDGWTCDQQSYADGSTCHCNCGIFDPDCSDNQSPIVGCKPDETCSSMATCILDTSKSQFPIGGCTATGPTSPGCWAWTLIALILVWFRKLNRAKTKLFLKKPNSG